jgi:hypothetical protein
MVVYKYWNMVEFYPDIYNICRYGPGRIGIVWGQTKRSLMQDVYTAWRRNMSNEACYTQRLSRRIILEYFPAWKQECYTQNTYHNLQLCVSTWYWREEYSTAALEPKLCKDNPVWDFGEYWKGSQDKQKTKN